MLKRRNLKYLTKKENREVILYQLLGVNTFKAMALQLEKVIHYHENKNIENDKYKKYNINYHPKDTSLQGIKDFKKFLYYNGFIHVKNSLIYSVIIMGVAFIPVVNYINFLLIPLLIMNLYCVMLQRYTYLRTEDTIRMMEHKNEVIVNAKVKKLEKINNEKEMVDKNKIDAELIDKIIAYLNNEEDVVLSSNDLESLQTINHYLELLNEKSKKVVDEAVNIINPEKEPVMVLKNN